MYQAIQRFSTRLNLPIGLKFQVLDCKLNTNLPAYFKSAEKTHRIMQLYHAQRGQDFSDAICSKGFLFTQMGNKGSGVYLANHSRYSWNWAPHNPALICDVIVDLDRIKRYRSEIYSPQWNSEYVIKDPELIYPKYILSYQIEGVRNKEILQQIGFVKHGQFGCFSCDHQVRGGITGVRCDCELTPVVDFQDLIEK